MSINLGVVGGFIAAEITPKKDATDQNDYRRDDEIQLNAWIA
jgi:hypothetical protein